MGRMSKRFTFITLALSSTVAFLVGVIAGTYSTIYIAAPVLLWLEGLWHRYFSGRTVSAAKVPRPRLSEVTR